MAAYGSPEYELTWKLWDMTSGPPISALRASGRRTSDSEFGGWPTPLVNDELGSGYCYGLKRADGTRPIFLKLPGAALLAGWPTPASIDATSNAENPDSKASRGSGGVNLTTAATFAGWPTPMAGSPGTDTYNPAGNTDSSRKTTELLAGWATPAAKEAGGTPEQFLARGPYKR